MIIHQADVCTITLSLCQNWQEMCIFMFHRMDVQCRDQCVLLMTNLCKISFLFWHGLFCLCCKVYLKGLKQPNPDALPTVRVIMQHTASNRLLCLWKIALSSIVVSSFEEEYSKGFENVSQTLERMSAVNYRRTFAKWDSCFVSSCERLDSNFLLTRRVKVFRGRKVHGEYDIKVEQVGVTCLTLCWILSNSATSHPSRRNDKWNTDCRGWTCYKKQP